MEEHMKRGEGLMRGAVVTGLSGPALLGACMGLLYGPLEMLTGAAAMVGLFLAVGVIMLPALCVSVASATATLRLGTMVGAYRAAWIDLGRVCLGVAPAFALFVVSAGISLWILVFLALAGIADARPGSTAQPWRPRQAGGCVRRFGDGRPWHWHWDCTGRSAGSCRREV
jgi:hypothetical protein